jgi:arabinose-5-phosphate isomerase
MKRVLNDLRAVLNIEAKAISKLGDGTLEQMQEAVRLLHGYTGPIIVTGMGKSGHIARKAAATFTSTGHRALFVHPAEASHGDMGLITASSIVIALSNSGETNELSDLLIYCKREGIPVIGITSYDNSTLARSSKVAITYGELDEACGNGIAPTTSTTVCLAILDALAVVLSKSINFTPADFRAWHPGGSLGARLRKVGEVMNKDFTWAAPDHKLTTVARSMGNGVLGVAVVKGKHGALGIITDGDIRRNLRKATTAKAKDIMTAEPLTIDDHETVDYAIEMMNSKRVTSLLVEDTLGAVTGVIHLHEALRAS